MEIIGKSMETMEMMEIKLLSPGDLDAYALILENGILPHRQPHVSLI